MRFDYIALRYYALAAAAIYIYIYNATYKWNALWFYFIILICVYITFHIYTCISIVNII